jgi:RNA recognition motif-containing protein
VQHRHKREGQMKTKIVVENLPPDVSDRDLRRLLDRFGDIVALDIARHPKTGKCLGSADVEMAEEDEAQDAVRYLDGTRWRGRELSVEFEDDDFWPLLKQQD